MTEPQERTFAAVLDELGRRGPRRSNVDLARAVGVRPSYIAALRTGQKDNPKLRMVCQLAEYLDVHPAYFLGGRPDRTTESLPNRTFAQKLGSLFALVCPPEQPELTTNAVVSMVRRHGHEIGNPTWTISAATLDGLRAGTIDNPGLVHVRALSRVFGAPPAYFLDDDLAARIEDQLETARAMRSLNIDALILRANRDDLRPVVRERILAALTSALGSTADPAAAAAPARPPARRIRRAR